MACINYEADNDRIRSIYLIGSLRNPAIRSVAAQLRIAGFDVFDDWHAAGEDADDIWREYEQQRNHSFQQALLGEFATNGYNMDKRNLDRCDAAVLVMPAGKSAHLELGYATGRGKKTFILMFDEPERWDLMYKFATGVAVGMEQLFSMLKGTPPEIAYYADYEQGVLFDDE